MPVTHVHVVTGLGPDSSQIREPSLWRPDLGREVVRDDDDFHATDGPRLVAKAVGSTMNSPATTNARPMASACHHQACPFANTSTAELTAITAVASAATCWWVHPISTSR
jgi:hypothetical protein